TSTTDRLTLYRYGDATADVFDDNALPGALTERANLVWGAVNTAASSSVTADLELTYGDVTVPTPAVRLVGRPGPAANWTNRNAEANISGTTATLPGQTSFGEYGVSEPAIYHVDAAATGSGDGTSFADGFTDLQEALDIATEGDVIVIAAGTYTPSARLDSADPRSATFEVTGEQDGLKIYGGFSGDETFGDVSDVEDELDSRDVSANETMLSGNLNDDENDDSGNAYHVLVFNAGEGIGADVSDNITEATVLDGVTVSGGNADSDSSPNDSGGGLFCDGEEDGNLCSPQITNTTFTGNSADDSGGAIYNNGINGGASSPEITNATFTGNSAGDGGAIYNDGTQGTSSPQIIGAVFTGNSADNAGGAIYNHGNSSGASSPQIINATVAGNSADDGGAIYNSAFFDGESSPQLTNAILWGNSATGDGTAIYNLSATPTLSYTLVEDGVEGDGIFDDSNSSTDDDNTFADDPLFADAGDPAGDNGTFGTDDDGLRLQNGSPALDTGDNTPFESGGVAEAVTTDLLGEDRIQNSTVSLGAYERGAAVARLALTATPGAEAHTLRLQNTGGAGVTSAEVDLGLSSGVSVTNNSGDGSVSDGTWTVDVPAEGTATVQIAYERDTSADPGLLDLTATLDTGSYTVEGGGTDASNSDDATADWALLEAPYGPGTALSFDGTEDYLRTGGSAEDVGLVGESFTVEAWVRVDDLTDDNPILGHGDSSPGTNQVLHLITRDNTLLMGFFANDLEGTATLEEGRWHHAAFVYDATDEEQRIYLDGKLDGTRDAEPFAGDQNERLRIGQWDGNQYLDGALDELRIWNEARSEADIQATMHQTIPADTPDLVTSYRFDAAQTDQRFDADHDGTTAYDLTGGRDAAFEGDPQWTTSGAPLGQESLVVEADDTGTVGPTGAALTVTGTDAPVTLYRYGDPSAEVFDDDGIPKEARSNAVWGAVPTGMTDLDADLELTYGDVTVPNPSDVGLAERPRPAQPWTAREEPPSSETFELTSQSEPREFTLYDSEPSILYVDAAASGTGTGSSWDDAFPNLQDGLNAASGLDVIVIAAGTYTPSERLEADDDRTATFEVTGEKDGLQIYGGWSGSESFSDVSDVENALDSRDRSANETILSGDIGTEDDTSDNAYHVFVFNGGDAIGMDTPENITDATVLDGVTITGANGAIAGGGLYCDGEGTGNACSPRVVNTDFTDNSVSSRGGAIYNNGTEGGTSSPQIAGSTFDGNSASDQGGAIFNNGTEGGTSSPQITGSTFTGNSALNRGGAIYNYGDGGTSSPQIIGSVFTDNSVTNGLSTGGAIGNEGSSGGTSSPQIIGSTFTDNAADDAAGAIYNEGSSGGTSSPQITGSTFTENTADFAGGAITSFGSDSVGNEGTISPEITGSTFTGNTSDSGGAIVNSSGEGTPTITNSILWGNSAGDGSEVYNFGPNMSLTLSHTLIQGDTAGISENDGSSTTEDGPIFDEDPLFADADDLAGDDGTFGTDDDGLRLEKGSPAIARGSFAPFEEGGIAEDITTDLAGDPRLFGARPDLGAYTFSDITSTSDDLADASDLLGYLEPNGFAGLVLLRENSATTGGLTFTRTGDAPNDPDGELPGGVAPYTWTVDAELDTSPTYDLLIRTDDIEGIDDFDTLMLYKSEDDGQTWDAVDTLGKFLLDEDRDLVAVQDLTGFSQFALASTDTDNPLPVELAGFEAQRSSEEAVTVQWETLSETNNAGFEVQRATGSAAVETSDSDVSTDESWETIATLDGAGTTDTPQSYQFEDADLPYAADSLAYRLRQIDTDGTASFSEEVTIARPVQAAELLPTYPNPARSTATVRFAVPERQDVRITLYDMLGRRVQTVVRADARGRTEAQLDVSGLASGTYFLRMQTDDGPVDTQRITVVR
ncbi:MAG: T9SS type A sorting domain-containing protein, partial [Spiribacter salinus]